MLFSLVLPAINTTVFSKIKVDTKFGEANHYGHKLMIINGATF